MTFSGAQSGQWFDPPITDGYLYQTTDGSLFTDILDFPTGFANDFTVEAEGQTLGAFGPEESVSFESLLGDGVNSSKILGINPGVDVEDETAFPIQLAFSTDSASFTMTAVPEPSTYAMALAGLACGGFSMWRRRKRA